MKNKAGNRTRTAVSNFDYSLRGNTISSLVKKWAQKCKEREICHTHTGNQPADVMLRNISGCSSLNSWVGENIIHTT